MPDHSESEQWLIKAALNLRMKAEREAGGRPAGSPVPGTLGRVARNQRRHLEWAEANGSRGVGIADLVNRIETQIYRADLTMSEYLQERVADWARGYERARFPLLEWLGFTADEYAAWVLEDKVSDRVVRNQLKWYMIRVLEGRR